MITLLGSVVTPAVVASLFALFFNARAEKQREFRSAVLDNLNESRTLVANAVQAAALYFSKPANKRTAELEAALWLAEREVRIGLSSLTERTEPTLQDDLDSLQKDFDFFIGELTGANFQQVDADVDLTHIRKVAGLGADLRLSLSRVYLAQLRNALSRDPIDRLLRFFEIGEYYAPLATKQSSRKR